MFFLSTFSTYKFIYPKKIILTMDKKFSFEIKRKIFHFFSISYIFIYYYISKYFSHRAALLCLVFILILLLFIEFVKIKYQKKVPLFHPLYREKEKNSLSGSIYLIIGVIIAFAIYDFEIAVVALLMMIFGDMAATLIGIRFGKHWLKYISGKSWEGIIAQFIVNMIVGFLFLKILIIVLAMAFVATLIGTILTSSDDNLAVPALAGFAGQATLIFLRISGLV